MTYLTGRAVRIYITKTPEQATAPAYSQENLGFFDFQVDTPLPVRYTRTCVCHTYVWRSYREGCDLGLFDFQLSTAEMSALDKM